MCAIVLATVTPVAESTSVKIIPSETQLPVSVEPLEGNPPANSFPPTRISSELRPGAFQVSVVLPAFAPAASVIGFGLAEMVDVGTVTNVRTVEVASTLDVAASTSEKVIPSLTQVPVTTLPLDANPPAMVLPSTMMLTLNPGAFQLSVVLPTVVPNAKVIGFGLAEKLTAAWLPSKNAFTLG